MDTSALAAPGAEEVDHVHVDSSRYEVSKWRWFVLAYFAICNCNQCLGWFTFSSCSEATIQGYFGPRMTHSTMDLLLNWGPIIGLLFFVPAVWVSSLRGGLRMAIWCGISGVFLGHVIRMIPVVAREFSGDESLAQNSFAFVCYHTGQILIAASGPFNMGAVTLLSVVWFAENERTTATAIAQVSNGLGTTLGFLNPLWLARSSAQIPNIFYFGFLLAVLPVVGAIVHLPSRPKRFPSAAAAAAAANEGTARGESQGPDDGPDGALPSADKAAPEMSWRELLRNRSFIVLTICVGVFAGAMAGWQGLLQSMLSPAGISESAVGWIGFGNGIGSNVAGVVSGSLIDRVFHRRLKSAILLGLTGCVLTLLWFMFSLPADESTDSPIPHSDLSLTAILFLCGASQGTAAPLFYELSAELMYPAKESTSAGIIVFVMNLSAAILIFLNNAFTTASMNITAISTVSVVLIAVALFVREEYKRPINAT